MGEPAMGQANTTMASATGLWRVGVLAFGTFVLGTDGYVIAGILPRVAAGMSVSVATAGQLVTVFALAYALGSPLVAVATARWARRRLLLAALGVFAVANVLAAVAPNFTVLTIARVLAALGAGGYTPVASVAAVSLVAPQRRGRALAVVTTGMTMAILAGVPVGALVGGIFGWRATFALITVLAVLAGAGLMLWLPALPPVPPVGLRARLSLLADRRLAILLAVTAAALAGGLSVYTYLLVVLAPLHPGPGIAALLLVSFGVGGLIGNAVGGVAADRYGPARTVTIALTALAATLIALAAASTDLIAALAVMLAWGVVGWAWIPPQQHRMLEGRGAAAPAALALNGSAIYLGIAAAGGLGGLLIHLANATTLPLAGAGLVLLAAATNLVTSRHP